MDQVRQRKGKDGDGTGFPVAAGEVAGHVSVARAESASRGGARGGGGLCATRGGGVVVL